MQFNDLMIKTKGYKVQIGAQVCRAAGKKEKSNYRQGAGKTRQRDKNTMRTKHQEKAGRWTHKVPRRTGKLEKEQSGQSQHKDRK